MIRFVRHMAGVLVPPAVVLLPCVALASPVFQWPVRGTLTSDYGPRDGRQHVGIDVAAAVGTPVGTIGDGVVVQAGVRGDYGLAVEVAHTGGWTSRYAHLDEVLVDVGVRLRRGELVGRVGETGNATGPHLHFEVRREGQPTDPFAVLP